MVPLLVTYRTDPSVVVVMRPRVVGLLGVGILLVGIIIVVDHFATPSDGTVVQLSNGPFPNDRLPVGYVLDPVSGLRDGDAVTAVDGTPVGALPGPSARRTGDTVSYTVLRDGATVPIAVTVTVGTFPVLEFLATAWMALLVLLVLLATAAFAFSSRPVDPAAQALLLCASLTFTGTIAYLLGDTVDRLFRAGPSPIDVAGELALAMVWGGVTHFALVVPGTRLAPRWWMLAAGYALPVVLHLGYLAVVLPQATTPLAVAGRIAQVSLVPSSVLPIVTALLMVLAYRAIDDAQSRRRLRWVIATLLFGGFAFLLIWTVPNALGWPVPPTYLIILLFLPPTLALGAAILRYRMFDVEIIVTRSLLYGGLTASAVGTYLAGAWLLSKVFVGNPTLTAVLASGLVGFIAPPLHLVLRRRVGRLVWGERDDPFEVLARLGRIDAASKPRNALDTVVETLAQALRLPFARIELWRAQSRFTMEASWGREGGHPEVLPLELAGGVLGRLVLAVGPGREPFGPADRRLLESVSRHVSRAAATVLLTAELQESRERIVLAREEERRGLHRRLHDGLGAELAAAVMRMEAAAALMSRDPVAARVHLDVQIIATRALVGDIRLLVHDLRPPALDQLGLVGALRERTSRMAAPSADGEVRVHIEPDGDLDDLPAAVEVAAFWIGIEAVSNAVRHARASNCRVRLIRDTGLTVQVEDDGNGLPAVVTAGGGFVTMRERAEELGGNCQVRGGRAGGGTVVEAHLPIREVSGS